MKRASLWIHGQAMPYGIHHQERIWKRGIWAMSPLDIFLAPAVTVGERRELWILPPFFLASSFAYNFVRK